ncbi:MAG: c-type cytochrome biogenesis protein CcmI [Paracoccus sp. (in: a-proteobacteria)]|uniref:c-type cytochrome biogenesis protein CcmI n=1 Tax=Paracoccus sp. TaxID=267 RepID=UPI0026DF2C94|nr:c-type cytochrome biogenesis protein CcmI [Paracoccus sp. (in: a-proteobacteria)]MDO5620479.1 c-type cytochrome biogenesis protein CcmI [Paracoccus sp. (in: a-proteobacteria)]
MFWLICAALAAIVALAIILPLRRADQTDAEPSAAWDLRVYRDQLAEVERDAARGIIAPAEAERLRAEIGRKVIEADRALKKAGTGRRQGPAGLWLAGLLALALAGSAWFYYRSGAPDLPDQPLAARLAQAQAAYDDRPAQAEAEATAPARPAVEADPQYVTLIEQLRRAVSERPDDPQGLELLAEHEARLGNMVAARQAYQHLIELRGDQASATDHARLAALMADAAGGLITPEAEAQITAALHKDPRQPTARYLAGMLQAQVGRYDLAFPIWRDLLEQGPADAPWVRAIAPQISDMAWLAGVPNYMSPVAPEAAVAMPQPSAEQMQAMQDLSPEDQQQAIAGMISGLESRLAEQGGTPAEWARLIRALTVSGQADRAAGILAEARQTFAENADALTVINQTASEVGLE